MRPPQSNGMSVEPEFPLQEGAAKLVRIAPSLQIGLHSCFLSFWSTLVNISAPSPLFSFH